jgi:hypothetical protein
MNFGGNTALIMVEGRAISEASYESVMNYLRESGGAGTDELRAQRVLFDMIRIEAIAGQFIENEGEVQLSENLALLEDGTKSMEDAAEEFGTVLGGAADGTVQVSRNSPFGPYFEFIAFSTAAGKMARPFRTINGYVVIKVDSHEKGATPEQDTVKCHVVQFPYSKDQKVMQAAQFKVNSGQISVLVRDQAVLDLLPALYKPAPPRMDPMAQIAAQIAACESSLEDLGDSDSDKRTALEAQLTALRDRLKAMQQTVPSANDAKGDVREAGKEAIKGQLEVVAPGQAKGKGN